MDNMLLLFSIYLIILLIHHLVTIGSPNLLDLVPQFLNRLIRLPDFVLIFCAFSLQLAKFSLPLILQSLNMVDQLLHLPLQVVPFLFPRSDIIIVLSIDLLYLLLHDSQRGFQVFLSCLQVELIVQHISVLLLQFVVLALIQFRLVYFRLQLFLYLVQLVFKFLHFF